MEGGPQCFAWWQHPTASLRVSRGEDSSWIQGRSPTCLLISKGVVERSEHRDINQPYKRSSSDIENKWARRPWAVKIVHECQFPLKWIRPFVGVVKQPPFWPRGGLPADWIKGQCVCVIDMHPCASNQHRGRPLLAQRHAGLKAKGSFQMHTEWEGAGHIPSESFALAKVRRPIHRSWCGWLYWFLIPVVNGDIQSKQKLLHLCLENATFTMYIILMCLEEARITVDPKCLMEFWQPMFLYITGMCRVTLSNFHRL